MLETLWLGILAFQSWFDWREYSVPFVLPFFAVAIAVGYMIDPLQSIIVLAVIVWALHVGPMSLALMGLLHPISFLMLPLAYQVRRGRMGLADLLVAGSVAAVFGWPALMGVIVGMETWRLWWRRNERTPVIPMLPGMTIGFLIWMALAQIGHQA